MKNKWVRLGILVFLLAGIYVVAEMAGFTEKLTVERIRAWMRAAGVAGFVVFVATFAIGELLYIPGLVWVAAAALAYGPVLGAVASILAGAISVAISFVIVRTIGGQPLTEISTPFFKKWLDRLEEHPLKSMIVIRLFLWAMPPVNYTLAMSGVRFRDYMLAAVIGITPAFVIFSFLFSFGFDLL